MGYTLDAYSVSSHSLHLYLYLPLFPLSPPHHHPSSPLLSLASLVSFFLSILVSASMADTGSTSSRRMWCSVPERVQLHVAMLALQFGYAGFHVVSRAALNMGISKLVFPVYRNIIALLLLAPFAYFLEKYETFSSLLLYKLSDTSPLLLYHNLSSRFFFDQEGATSAFYLFCCSVLSPSTCWVRIRFNN